MKVRVKDLSIEMEVKSKGIEFGVRATDDKHLGDLVLTNTGLTWCKGKISRKNGIKVRRKDFIAFMEAE